MPTLTTTKKPKRQKLRNAEYYGLQALQDRLYADSKDGKHFKNLVSIITSEENIQLAYRILRRIPVAKPQAQTVKPFGT